jgi:hypothetical protein
MHAGWKTSIVALAAVAGGVIACGDGGDTGDGADAGVDGSSSGTSVGGSGDASSGVDAASGGSATGGTVGGATSGDGTCDTLCSLSANSGCDSAVSAADCVPGCEGDLTGSCAPELQALLNCVAAHPAVACSILGIVYFPDCETEQEAFFICSDA